MNLQLEAEDVFRKTYRQGKRRAVMRSPRRDRLLAGLTPLLRPGRSGGELYQGIQDVRVSDIIGSEDRSSDFLFDFSPRYQWMFPRWKSVYVYMLQSKAPPPLSLILFGGKYFIRDGHHRVSVAKSIEQRYISGEIRKVPVALNLPDDYRNSQAEVFNEKLAFHERTAVFEILPHNYFDVKKASTWKLLEDEIFVKNRTWFMRKHARNPESNGELLESWTRNLYEDAANYIRSHSLAYLFPESGVTDIFVEFIRFWNSFPDPDSIWLKDAYSRFSEHAARGRQGREWMRKLSSGVRQRFEPVESLYMRFRRFSQIDELIPEFEIPEITRGFIRYLHHQVFIDYAKHLEKKFGRAPYIQEITHGWYHGFYYPLLQLHGECASRQRFSRFYRQYSARYFEIFKTNPEHLKSIYEDFCQENSQA